MKKTTIFEIIITVVGLALIGIIGTQAITIRKQRANAISLSLGESIPKLELVTLKNEPFDETIFSSKRNKVTMLCIFQTPCSSCSKAIGPWRMLANYFGDKLTVIAIIPANKQDSSNFNESGQLNFKVYQPVDAVRFRTKMRLKTKLSQTIVLKGENVVAIKIGDLDEEDFQSLVNTINDILKT